MYVPAQEDSPSAIGLEFSENAKSDQKNEIIKVIFFIFKIYIKKFTSNLFLTMVICKLKKFLH